MANPLSLAEQELKHFVENASEGLHWVGPDGTVLWANQTELDLLGDTRKEYIGHQIAEFYLHPEVIEDIMARLVRHETIRDREVALVCKDESVKHVLIHATVRWEDGKFIHTRGFTRDITDRRTAQDISNRLAAIVQFSDDAIVSKDLQGIIRSWNLAAERMFGYSAAEAVGRSIRMIIPADRQAEEDEVLRRIQRGEIVDHFETIRLRKDGSELEVSLTVSPVKDAGGTIIGASKITRDITLRRQIELERSQLLEREQAARLAADSSNRIKDEFLAMLSHELRTPLNAILGWTQIATAASRGRDEEAAKTTVRRAIEVIERNAMAQARLIDDLLDVSRVVSGKLDLNTEIVDLPALMVTVADGARPAAAAKSLDLRLRLDAANAPVVGDAARLQQIVWNLISNAIKFTPKGGVIELAVERDASHVTLAVRDTGVGIEPDFLPHVFERFRQADTTTTRRFGGLGLGLAVVQYLVSAHGGTVAARSPGKGFGATFVVTLPLAASVHPESARRDTDRVAPLEGVLALVVDDDPDSRDLLGHMLQQRGAEITTAASVQEALSVIERQPFDVVLADLGMPESDGFHLIAAIRSHARRSIRALRAIAVTAYAGDDARARSLAAGYDDYVPKPVALNTLAGAIATLLSRDRS